MNLNISKKIFHSKKTKQNNCCHSLNFIGNRVSFFEEKREIRGKEVRQHCENQILSLLMHWKSKQITLNFGGTAAGQSVRNVSLHTSLWLK